MDRLRNILRAYIENQQIKPIARRFRLSKTTLKKYLTRCRDSGLPWEQIIELPDGDLRKILYTVDEHEHDGRQLDLEAQMDHFLEELTRKGVTRKLLWKEYKLKDSGGFSYSRFCEHLGKHIASKNVTLALQHEPGHELMLDFAGKKLSWVDQSTGQVH